MAKGTPPKDSVKFVQNQTVFQNIIECEHARSEAHIKSEALHLWVSDGGSPDEFERVWPLMRLDVLNFT